MRHDSRHRSLYSRATMLSTGRRKLHALCACAFFMQVGSKLELVLLADRGADGVAESACMKVYAIPPPMMRVSTLSMRLLMTPILSETFAPPRIAVNGRCGIGQSLAHHADFLLDEVAAYCREVIRNAGGGSVSAVRGSECVIDDRSQPWKQALLRMRDRSFPLPCGSGRFRSS